MTSDNRGFVPPNETATENILYYCAIWPNTAERCAEDVPCYLVRRGRRRPMATHAERITIFILYTYCASLKPPKVLTSVSGQLSAVINKVASDTHLAH